jgi:hypothetical protein
VVVFSAACASLFSIVSLPIPKKKTEKKKKEKRKKA